MKVAGIEAATLFKESSGITRDQYVESVSEAGKHINRRDYLDVFMDDSTDIADEFLSLPGGLSGHGRRELAGMDHYHQKRRQHKT